MTAEATTSVFVSYSRSDRSRVTGLGLLLEALGHQVFIDHYTIKPGMRWEARLQQGLDEARVLLVFWTKRARDSLWVRQEIEYFHVHLPDRPIVPVLGDETPLSELLAPYQHSDFCPLINELLDLKRHMQEAKATPDQIRKAVLARLEDAGIQIDEKDRTKLFALFAPAGLAGLIAAPLAFLDRLGNTGLEAAAQLSAAQVGLLGAAAISGAVVCGLTENAADGDAFRVTNIAYPQTVVSDAPKSNLMVRFEGEPVFPLEMILRQTTCPDGYSCETLRAEFQTRPDNDTLTGEGWVYCQSVSAAWAMEYEVLLRDSTGAEASSAALVQCLPRPAPGGLRRD